MGLFVRCPHSIDWPVVLGYCVLEDMELIYQKVFQVNPCIGDYWQGKEGAGSDLFGLIEWVLLADLVLL